MTGGSWKLQTALAISGQNLLTNTVAPVALSATPTASQSLVYGTGAGTLTIITNNTYVIGPSGTLTLNLFDGSMTDMAGATAPFRLLRGYSIFVQSGGDSTGVTIGNAGSNPHPLFFGATSATKTIYPGGPDDSGGTGVGTGVAVTSTVANVKIVNNSPSAFVTVVVTFTGTQCVTGVPMGLGLLLTYP